MFRRFVTAALVVSSLVVSSFAFAGNTEGPSSRNTRVEGHKTDVYVIALRGGEKASILVN